MPRPKGSKNKNSEVIVEVKEIQSAVFEDPEDLLPADLAATDFVIAQIRHKTEKEFVGYHPITGAEIWI